MTQKKAEFLMVLATLGWGASYMFMKMGLESIDAYNLIALRFLLAFLVTVPILIIKKKRIDRITCLYSIVLGILLFLVFAFLLVALKTTQTSHAGFLVGLTVVFVPLIQILFAREKPSRQIVFSVSLSIVGIAFLTIKDHFTVEPGDFLCILTALTYAFHIFITNRASQKADTLNLGVLQLGVTGLLGLVFSLIFESTVLPESKPAWIAILSLALICSAYGFIIQSITQKYNSAARTGIIFSLEPIFAALFGVALLHESFGAKDLIGASLVFLGIFLSRQKPFVDMPKISKRAS